MGWHPSKERGHSHSASSTRVEHRMLDLLQDHPDKDRSEPRPKAVAVPELTLPPETPVEVRDRCTSDFLAGLVTDPGIGAFSRYSPQAADRQLAALVKVSALQGSRVLVALRGRSVVAYLTFHPAEPDSRWASFPHGQILELGGIEVARCMRGRGLARTLMDLAFSPPDFDAVIVYAQALTWCWDLQGSALSLEDYRQMMLRLFGAYGFEPYLTDEPNIRYDRANLLLARLGREVPPLLVSQFLASLVEGSGT